MPVLDAPAAPAREIIKVRLTEVEYLTLVRLAEAELRPLVDQARLMIREGLHTRGYLAATAEGVTDASAAY